MQNITYLLKLIILEFLEIFFLHRYIYQFFINFSLFRLINYFFNKDCYPFRDKNTNKFLQNNKFLIKTNNCKNKELILVDLTVGHVPEYNMLNCLIARDLSSFTSGKCIGLVKKYDFKSKLIAKSFGIENFIYLEKKNFFKKILNFFFSIKLSKKCNTLKKLLKLEYKGIEVGKSAYEHYTRNLSKQKKFKFNFSLYLCISDSIDTVDFFEKLFQKSKFNHCVMGEVQFIPHKLFFHQCLKNKVKVYARHGESLHNYHVRIYKNKRYLYSHRGKFSYKLVNYLLKYHRKKLVLLVNKFFKKNDPIKRIGSEPFINSRGVLVKNKKKTINFNNKKDFDNFFQFNQARPTFLILPNALQDNIFNSEWSSFETPLEWFLDTLKCIDKLNNINWIIKVHPSEKFYRKELSVTKLFSQFIFKNKNIKFLNNQIYINDLYKYIDCVVTYNGSCGYQYPSIGIPAFLVADSRYFNLKCSFNFKKKSEYFRNLSSFNKNKKLDSEKKFFAKLFWYLDSPNGPTRMTHGLLPKIKVRKEQNWNIFWKELYLNNKRFKKNMNNFTKFFEIQYKLNNRHPLNFKTLGVKNLSKLVSFNDI